MTMIHNILSSVLLLVLLMAVDVSALKGGKKKNGPAMDPIETLVPTSGYVITPAPGANGQFGLTGEYWSDSGAVGTILGSGGYMKSSNVCWRIDDTEAFYCLGTYEFEGYDGIMQVQGLYPDNATGGQFVIVGGTGDWAGVRGIQTTEFDVVAQESRQLFTFE